MSFVREVKSEINDKSLLVSSLQTLGYSPCVGENLTLRGDRTETTRGFEVLMKKEQTGLRGDMGFKREKNGTFTFAMDSYVIRDFTPDEFMTRVKAAFFVQQARQTAEYQGMELESQQQVNPDVVRLEYVRTR